MAAGLRALLALCFVFVAVQGQSADADVFYVDGSSTSNNATCGSQMEPCPSVTEGIRVACNYSASYGNILVSVEVFPGQYNEKNIVVTCPLSLRFVSALHKAQEG